MPGFPLYKDTDLRRATAHQLYCFAIEVWFGANGFNAVSVGCADLGADSGAEAETRDEAGAES